jgi:hypothetical protein
VIVHTVVSGGTVLLLLVLLTILGRALMLVDADALALCVFEAVAV